MLGKVFDWLSNLRPRQLFLLAGASAIIIFCIMYIGLNHFSKQVPLPISIGEEVEQVPEVQMVNVVVAARNIEAKSMIVGSMLATKEVPQDQVPPESVFDPSEIVNKPARVRILKDEIITQPQVYRNIEQSGFVGSIPPDCRAVSIQVNDVTGVAGFAKPGDYVDVLMIESDATKTSATSRLILQNVLLLSINKSMTYDVPPAQPEQQQQQGGGEGEQPAESTVNPATQAIENPALATLAIRPDEVLQLVSASKIGEIYLMLRPLVPQGDYYTGAEYTMDSLKKQQTEQKEEVRQSTLFETMVQGKDDFTYSNKGGKASENQIAIMYGDVEKSTSSAPSSGSQSNTPNSSGNSSNANTADSANEAASEVVGQTVNQLRGRN